MKDKVMIGIVGFNGIVPGASENFAEFFYRLGINYGDRFEFFIQVMEKKEQFRARNLLTEAALGLGCKYMMQVDDDSVLNSNTFGALLQVMEENENVGIVGALYAQRGDPHRLVAMDGREITPGNWHTSWIPWSELKREPMEVTVAGGGCLLFDMQLFEEMNQPYFWVDGVSGTDVQICLKAKEMGYRVFVHGGHEIGHLSLGRIIYPSSMPYELELFNQYAEKYLGYVKEEGNFGFKNVKETLARAQYTYAKLWEEMNPKTSEEVEDFYTNPEVAKWAVFKGVAYAFCVQPGMDHYQEFVRVLLALSLKWGRQPVAGFDYGCGVGIACRMMEDQDILVHGYDLAGEHLVFAQEHTSRAAIRHVSHFDVDFTYNLGVCLDVIEHLMFPEVTLRMIAQCIKIGGFLYTNAHLYDFKGKSEGVPQHLNKLSNEEVVEILRLEGFVPTKLSPFLLEKKYGYTKQNVACGSQ